MRGIGRVKAIGMVAAALALCADTSLSAFASTTSVTIAGGASLTVWEQRGCALPGRGRESSSLGYSLMDAAGTHLGLVPTTADAARDAEPTLTLDESGSAVLVWSRFDGSFRKIAYARFAGGAWTNVHYLTFGPGNNYEPRIGTSLAGSFLFYYGQPDTYQYAPLDLVTGRLFAAPKTLDLGSAGRDVATQRTPGGFSIQGATDVPVTGVKGAEQRTGGGGLRPIIQGAVDVPVTGNRTHAVIWAVGSGGDCRGIVLLIPAPGLESALVFRFANGRTGLLHRVDLPARVAERFGADLAASYLPIACF